MLNNGDSITVQVLAADFNGDMTVSGRILGVKEIKEFKLTEIHLSRAFLISGGFGLLLAGSDGSGEFVAGLKVAFEVKILIRNGRARAGQLAVQETGEQCFSADGLPRCDLERTTVTP